MLKTPTRNDSAVRLLDRHLNLCVLGDARSPHILNRTTAITSLGHRAHVIATEALSGQPPATAAFPVEAPSPISVSGPLAKIAILWRLVWFYRRIRKIRPDLTWVHYALGDHATMALVAARSPLVVTVMGGDVLFDEQGNIPPLQRRMVRLILRNAALVLAKSDYLVGIVRQMGVPQERILRVIWGVDFEQFSQRDALSLRQELSITAAAPVIFSPRAMQPFYNIHLLIEAMPAVLARVPDAVLVLSEFSATPPYRDELRSLVRKLGVDASVRFAGQISQARMPFYLSLASVAINVPPSDGLPMSLLEAMACGTPSVLTKLDRYKEVVEDGRTALFTELNAAAIAEALLQLLTDRELHDRMAVASLDRVRNVADLRRDAQMVSDRMVEVVSEGHGLVPLTERLRAIGLLAAFWVSRLCGGLWRGRTRQK